MKIAFFSSLILSLFACTYLPIHILLNNGGYDFAFSVGAMGAIASILVIASWHSWHYSTDQKIARLEKKLRARRKRQALNRIAR